ncbi:hypothetical protein AVEN_224297-1 [Araneus ventricosus]|uniref:Uncharacterized protein n=1 Tax=Araneus ventricosus TaxID=182803 RepID=A0A4Y2M9Z1_ARAVE|nr:hypothetical protein AVEN_224297-1 [Araneus ventricosus]
MELLTEQLYEEAHFPQPFRRSMWLQHDGAPPHYSNDVRQHLTLHLESIGHVVMVRLIGLLGRRTSRALLGSNGDTGVRDPR